MKYSTKMHNDHISLKIDIQLTQECITILSYNINKGLVVHNKNIVRNDFFTDISFYNMILSDQDINTDKIKHVKVENFLRVDDFVKTYNSLVELKRNDDDSFDNYNLKLFVINSDKKLILNKDVDLLKIYKYISSKIEYVLELIFGNIKTNYKQIECFIKCETLFSKQINEELEYQLENNIDNITIKICKEGKFISTENTLNIFDQFPKTSLKIKLDGSTKESVMIPEFAVDSSAIECIQPYLHLISKDKTNKLISLKINDELIETKYRFSDILCDIEPNVKVYNTSYYGFKIGFYINLYQDLMLAVQDDKLDIRKYDIINSILSKEYIKE